MTDEADCYIIMRVKAPIGLVCVGIDSHPPKRAYKHDVVCIGVCEEREDSTVKCKPALVMTPREAVHVGASLIRASILGELRIRRKKETGWEWATDWESLFKEVKKEIKKEKKKT